MNNKRFFFLALTLVLAALMLGACATPSVDELLTEAAVEQTAAPEATVEQTVEAEPTEAAKAVDLEAAYKPFLAEMKGYDIITVDGLKEALSEKAPFLLDVREDKEVEESGYIEGTVHVPVRDLAKHLDLLPAFDAPIVVYCGSGWRSGLALTGLSAMGWKDVRSLKGGFGAWKDAGGAVVEGMPPEAAALNAAEPDPALVAVFDKTFSDLPEGWGALPPENLAEELADKPEDLVILDVRTEKEVIENGRLEGSINIPIEQFIDRQSEWPGKDANIVLVCASGHRGNIASIILRSYGYTNLRNLKGGLAAWTAAGNPLAGGLKPAYTTFLAEMKGYDVITVDGLKEIMAEKPPFLLDVREDKEVEESGYIEGTVHVPVRDLAKHLDLLPAFDAPIVVYCGSGWRSGLALTGLSAMGWKDVRSLKGGFGAWKDAGGAVVEGMPPEAAALNAAEPDPALVAVFDKTFSDLPEGWGALPPENLAEELADKPEDLVILDVRTEKEVAEAGMIEGAINIPIEEFMTRQAEWPSKDVNIVLVCASGHRGNIASIILRSYGYTNLRNLKGGLAAWTAAGNPLVPKSAN